MAEIKVEQKKSHVWAWVLGIIVAALLIWALVEAFDNDAETMADYSWIDNVQTLEAPAALDGGAAAPWLALEDLARAS